MNAKINVNLERRATKTLIRWYRKLSLFGWVGIFGPKPDPREHDNERYMVPIRAIQIELGRRVLREANWGRE